MVEETGEETGASPQTAPDESEAAQATMDTPANAGSQAAADTPAAADRHEPGETNSRSALPPETAPQDAQNANAEAPLPVAPLAAPGNLQSDGEMARDAPPPSPQPTGMKAQDAGDLRPRIAIIISELGMSNAAARQAIAMLPPAISFSFNPYGHNLQQLANEARAAGHEVLLQVPMEPQGYPRLDPGVHGLRTDLTSEENLARLDWALNRFTGYIGITNQMGSKFTKDADALTPVLNEVRGKELIYLDSRTAADSIAADIALDLGIPVVINNRFLDHRAETAVMDENFAALETIARRTGSAVGIAYPSEKSYTYLIDWAKELEAKGLRLVPISALANKQEAR
ncbi:divergent polysaccharide deacetylase family protein [Sneathiella sp.]|uniref:divergent polysaccharide deacetylase family protein n=1 Tax=Sneathiella sp. TaxID=1964365 RepID=UPI002FE2A12D